MTHANLYLMVGLPGSGKTTAARRIEEDCRALRLTPDEWLKPLFGDANPEAARDLIEGRFIAIGLRSLSLGVDVVLDFGFWSRAERAGLREVAKEVGATAVLQFEDVPANERSRRLAERYRANPDSDWQLDESDLSQYEALFEKPSANEIAGNWAEPIPDGFDSWKQWVAHRWPTSFDT